MNPISVTIRPSPSRAWNEHASRTKAFDIQYGPGRVITCSKDQIPDVVERLLKDDDHG